MIHKLKLYLLRRRINIIMFIGMTSIITTLVLVFAALVQINRQSQYNQQILRGLSCILLILPENRTQDKVMKCIEVNDVNESDFLFKTLDDVTDVPIKTETDKTGKSVYILPVKGDKGDVGEKGADGKPGPTGPTGATGLNGLAGADGITIEGSDGQDGTDGQNGREIELQTNPKNGNLEWRYVGEEIWIVLMKKCSPTIVTNCLP